MATVILVRHGRTLANAGGILAGWEHGVHLDDHGRAAAGAVGARLAGRGLRPVRVVSSPLVRAVETAELVGTGCAPDVRVEIDERLGECRYGAWTGRALKDLADEPLWRVVQDHPSAARFPDGPEHPGESIAEMSARAVLAVRQTDSAVSAEHGPDGVWLAVSHGDVIKAVLADALGMHLDAFQRLVVDPASVSIVRYAPSRPAVLRINDTGALPDLARRADTPGEQGDAVVGGGAG